EGAVDDPQTRRAATVVFVVDTAPVSGGRVAAERAVEDLHACATTGEDGVQDAAANASGVAAQGAIDDAHGCITGRLSIVPDTGPLVARIAAQGAVEDGQDSAAGDA